jgi:hypothetical protein
MLDPEFAEEIEIEAHGSCFEAIDYLMYKIGDEMPEGSSVEDLHETTRLIVRGLRRLADETELSVLDCEENGGCDHAD